MLAVSYTTGVVSPQFIQKKILKNRVWVQYWVLVSSKWIKCSTFVSVDKISKAKIARTVERSKSVEFNQSPDSIGYARTITGQWTNGLSCTCSNFNSNNAVFVDGKKVCKHTIAYAKQFWSCQKLSDYVNAVKPLSTVA